MKMRSWGIPLLSVALTTLVVANAYYQKKQFYPSVVYITKSNPSMAVIYIQAFIAVFLVGKLMRKVFFGELRTSEFEHLMERSWYAITETCLAFTVFRDDFNPKFVALFTLLLFLKSFHWLAEDRVDFMERSPIISYLFHIRVLALLLVLGLLDIYFVEHAYQSTMATGASVQLVFGFEYAILITMVINITIKYALYSVDMNSETPWDNKAVFLLYTELIMGLIKVMLYAAFVVIMIRIYTLPLFALRPMYYTLRNFKKAFNDVILSRRAIHNMNTLYPDATEEELQAGDNVCIICREEMTVAAKKLPCNHIFHASCLRSWFQRQQTCPTCRLNILRTNPTTPQTAQADRQAPRVQPVPNMANIPNQFNFNMPNPFVVLNNGARNNVAPEQRAPFGAAGAVPNNAADAGSSGSQQQQQHMPPPFFPFPPMPFLAPPPMPPPNLSSLTTEQLRRMEGNERENVEARIQWLKNIQLMLDAAVLMMQQYNTAAAISLSMQPPADDGPGLGPGTNNGPIPNGNASSASTSNANAEARSSASDAAAAAAATVDDLEELVASASASPSSSIDASNSGLDGVEDLRESSSLESEIRKRRLRKFTQRLEQQLQQQQPQAANDDS